MRSRRRPRLLLLLTALLLALAGGLVVAGPAAAAGPTVTGISVHSGTLAGGTTVTLTGTGFTASSYAQFGGPVAASSTTVSSTKIVAVTERHPEGTVWVRVRTGGALSPLSTAAQFTYVHSDTTAPPAPTLDPAATANLAGRLRVGWHPVSAPDLVGYNIYVKYLGDTAWRKMQSETPGSYDGNGPVDFDPWSEVPAYTGNRYQIAITAVDTSYNESAKSPVVSGRSTPDDVVLFDFGYVHWALGDQTVGGSGFLVGQDVTWSPEVAKTIVVKGELGVARGATLTLAPGTRIQFEHSYDPVDYQSGYIPGALLVEDHGGLVVNGTAAKPVILTKTADTYGGPAWSGSTDNTGHPIDQNWYGVVAQTKAHVVLNNLRLRYTDHSASRCDWLVYYDSEVCRDR
jgi:hypothetical protein